MVKFEVLIIECEVQGCWSGFPRFRCGLGIDEVASV